MATIGIKAPAQHTGIDALRRFWAIADEAGFDSLWVFDHLLPMGRDRSGDIFEAWTLLAAMAQATERIRIGTLVSGNGYRHPALLAKMAVTVDHLSGGRLELGIGAGGDAAADGMLGLPLPAARERIERLGEACEVLRLLWREPVAEFSGSHYRLTGALADPKPVQPGGPPLWLGSSGRRYGLRVVAEQADAWFSAQYLRPVSADPDGEDVAEWHRLSAVLDRHCAEAGRDPAAIRRAVQLPLPPDPDDALRTVERYLAAGASDLVLWSAQPKDTAELLPRIRDLG